MTTSTKTDKGMEALAAATIRARELANIATPSAPRQMRPVVLNWVQSSQGLHETWNARHPVIGSYQITRSGYEGPYEIATPFLAGKVIYTSRETLEEAKEFASEHLFSVACSLLADS